MASSRITVYLFCLLSICQSCVNAGKKIVSPKHRLNEIKTVNGEKIKTGIWIESIDSAIQIANYQDGIREGESKTIYKNGEYSIENYKNGVRQGWSKSYSSFGFLYFEIFYENGNAVKRRTYTPSF